MNSTSAATLMHTSTAFTVALTVSRGIGVPAPSMNDAERPTAMAAAVSVCTLPLAISGAPAIAKRSAAASATTAKNWGS